jgi:hypothetical protein
MGLTAKKINNLTRQIEEKSGKTRNAHATKLERIKSER